jgi:hypothetical protein
MSRFYESEPQIEEIVRGFETCGTAKTDFHHREHLTVAVWYLQTLSKEETVSRMRAGLLRFLDHHGVDRKKYSEEVTVFWVDAIASHLEAIGAQASLLEKCNQVIDALASGQLTQDVSSTARTPAARVEAEASLAKS